MRLAVVVGLFAASVDHREIRASAFVVPPISTTRRAVVISRCERCPRSSAVRAHPPATSREDDDNVNGDGADDDRRPRQPLLHCAASTQASNKGILVIEALRSSAAPSFATAGHERGTVRLWECTTDTATASPTISVRLERVGEIDESHRGSIFSLSSLPWRSCGGELPAQSERALVCQQREAWLVSGAMDRSASLHHLTRGFKQNDQTCDARASMEKSDRGDDEYGCGVECQPALTGATTVSIKTVSSLTDHTGWVRGVAPLVFGGDENDDGTKHDFDQGQHVHESGDNRESHTHSKNESDPPPKMCCLSIGCNFINAWTAKVPTSLTNTIEEFDSGSSRDSSSFRLARFDGGPSPSDPHDERDFRRHDITCFATDVDTSRETERGKEQRRQQARWIAAGLVDGSLRAFAVPTGDDWEGRFAKSVAGARGNDDGEFSDLGPAASVNAHRGRIVGIHAVPSLLSSSKWSSVDAARAAEDGVSCFDFISVGREDGTWKRWALVLTGRKTEEGRGGPNPTSTVDAGAAAVAQDVRESATDRRLGIASNAQFRCLDQGLALPSGCDDYISCSVVVPANFSSLATAAEDGSSEGLVTDASNAFSSLLFVGTVGGSVYCSDGSTCVEVWKEKESGGSTTSISSISALEWIALQDEQDEQRRIGIIIGTSNGIVKVLT